MSTWPEALFAVWTLAIVVRQLRPKRSQLLRRLDVFGLVPSWRLFGPNAPASDVLVYALSVSKPGAEAARVEVAMPFRRRRWLNVVWNPDRRLRKSFSHLVGVVDGAKASHQQGRVRRARQILLQHLLSLPMEDKGTCRQLLLVRQSVRRSVPRKVIFRTDWYRHRGDNAS